MLRRTQPNQGLPLIKLGTLLIRQMTKPMVGRLVASTKEHPAMMRFCIALGRLSMGSTGALQERGRTEEKRAIEQKHVEKQREEKKSRNEAMRTYLREAAVQDATRTVEHRLQASEAAWKEERELLRRQIELLMTRIESGDLGNVPREKIVVEDTASVSRQQPNEDEGTTPPPGRVSVEDSTPSAAEVSSNLKSSSASQSQSVVEPVPATTASTSPPSNAKTLPKRAPHWSLGQVAGSDVLRSRLHDRFYDTRVPDAALRDGGAEILADLVVYFVLAMVLMYEYNQSKKTEQRKEDVQNARLKALEAKVNELVGAHGEDNIGILERIPPARLPLSIFTWPVHTMKTLVMGKPVAQ